MSNLNSELGQAIKAVPKPKEDIGIDTDGALLNNIVNAAIQSSLDVAALENFTTVSQSRETMYKVIDQMSQDSTIASILETYAEDCVEPNDNGKIVWVESSDEKVSKFVTYLLDTINVDKHAYDWIFNFIKYGDLYLRLYRESDYDFDNIFAVDTRKDLKESLDKVLDETDNKTTLQEAVNLKLHKPGDHYAPYLEMIPNPGEVFELTKFGKTMGYIKTQVSSETQTSNQHYNLINYKMKKRDVDVYEATDFVHATLSDTSSRVPEEVKIFMDDASYNSDTDALTYTVRRGQSLLYTVYKIWRQLTLLETSVLLNRVTKSSIVRMIQVEVGDMPKENIGAHLMSIKNLIEQKSALDPGNSMSEYTNPGPVENNIYVPTHGGVGAITTQQIGGDVDPKQLTDLDYFQNKFFGAMRVPKQFFGITDDAAGFNGGSSLSIISSRYGKAIKRIQNTFVQALTDAINLMLIDRNLSSYVNKFQLKMSAPITQEELDKRDNLSNRVRVISDIMTQFTDIETRETRLKILKSLLSTVITDPEILNLIQEEIDLSSETDSDITSNKDTNNNDTDVDLLPIDDEIEEESNIPDDIDLNDVPSEAFTPENEPVEDTNFEESLQLNEDEIFLPSPSQLNIDMT